MNCDDCRPNHPQWRRSCKNLSALANPGGDAPNLASVVILQVCRD